MLKTSTIELLKVASCNKTTSKNYRKKVCLGLKYYRCLTFGIYPDEKAHYYIVLTASGARKVGWG